MSRKGALSQSSFLLRFFVERNPADTTDHIFKPGHYFLFLKSHLNIYVFPKYFTKILIYSVHLSNVPYL